MIDILHSRASRIYEYSRLLNSARYAFESGALNEADWMSIQQFVAEELGKILREWMEERKGA